MTLQEPFYEGGYRFYMYPCDTNNQVSNNSRVFYGSLLYKDIFIEIKIGKPAEQVVIDLQIPLIPEGCL